MIKTIKAFTLIELIISLIIISVLMLIIFPSMHSLVADNNLDFSVNKIVTALQFTRAEAIRNGSVIRFCKSKNKINCADDADNDWSVGQIIVNQQSNSLIRVVDTLPIGDKLFWTSTFSKNKFLDFFPSGTTGDQQGTFLYCHFESGQQINAMAIIVQETGHVRISNLTADNRAIVCG